MQVSKRIAAPTHAVWATVTDLDRSAQVLSGVESIERLDQGCGFECGTRWRETRTMMGRTATEELEVTALDSGRSYTVEADGRGAHYISRLTLEEVAGATELTMSFEGQPIGTVARVLAALTYPLARRATRNMIARDLDDIAIEAEQGAALRA
jgi:carbon monoxide dehydrogenase subunit G